MSHYTVDLRNLINIYGYTREEIEGWFSSYELSDYLNQNQIGIITDNGVWSKEKLAKKIVDFYLMREIGLETPALFEHYTKITMERIMEKYLPIIYSNSLSFDLLKNQNVTEVIERYRTETGSNTGTSSSSSSGITVNSDTPQGQIVKANILAGQYATSTNAGENEGSASSTSSGSSTGSETITRNLNGKDSRKTYQELIKEYRDNIIAVDSKIIDELNPLFMGLF